MKKQTLKVAIVAATLAIGTTLAGCKAKEKLFGPDETTVDPVASEQVAEGKATACVVVDQVAADQAFEQLGLQCEVAPPTPPVTEETHPLPEVLATHEAT